MPGTAVVIGVTGLAGLEEDVRVLRRAAEDRLFRRQGPLAMGVDHRQIDHLGHLFVGELLDLVDLVRDAEAVEEVDERHPGFQRGGLGDQGHVLGLLHRNGGKHGPAGRTAGHHVAMVAEDRQRVGGHGAGGDMEDGRGQFPGDLEHVGDHQQEALDGREGGRQGSGLQRPVDRAGGARLALHFHHVRHGAEDVLAARRPPRRPASPPSPKRE